VHPPRQSVSEIRLVWPVARPGLDRYCRLVDKH